MSDTKTRAISLRLDEDRAARRDELAAATDRSRAWHLERAVDAYLEDQAWQIAHIEKGLADADAGRTLPHDQVRDWLATWGRKKESDPPA